MTWEFRKSSFSGENGNNCVEIARATTVVAIRDSKSVDGVLSVSPAAFDRLLALSKSATR
jgi:hypothetical protein